MTPPVTVSYPASPIKPRIRATKAEVEGRRAAFWKIIADGRPMTVRQVFYQATVRGLVPKTEAGYAMVQNDLTIMRRAGDLDYGWLAEKRSERWRRTPTSCSSGSR
jgi:hypothetical protein